MGAQTEAEARNRYENLLNRKPAVHLVAPPFRTSRRCPVVQFQALLKRMLGLGMLKPFS